MTKQYDMHPALEAAGWTVTRKASKTPSGEIIGIYWFTHAATGRIVEFSVTETVEMRPMGNPRYSGLVETSWKMLALLSMSEKAVLSSEEVAANAAK
jgi:hypothetical protein